MSDSCNYGNIFRTSPGIRLAVLFGSFFLLLFISSVASLAMNEIPFGSVRDRQLCQSACQSILVFCLPAFLLARFSSNTPGRWLCIDNPPGLRGIIGVCIVYLIAFPAMEWLIEWNKNIHLPQSMTGLENILRDWENTNDSVASVMLNAQGIPAMIIGVLIIGLLTGISEELFFRGGFQGILQRTAIGKNMSVWIAAIIFSTMHFQFFGFIPRLLMGAYFGYLYLWCGNLWIPIIAHALNNSVVVVVAYALGEENINALDSGLAQGNIFLPLISLALTFMFFMLFRRYFFRRS